MHANFRKFDLNRANDGASANASPSHALIVFFKLSILASCMANLSIFHVVFSSNTLIRLNKDAFEGHLCKPLIIVSQYSTGPQHNMGCKLYA